MHHSYIDKLATRDNALTRRDPRAKLAVALSLAVAITLVPHGQFGRLGLLGLLLAVPAAVSPLSAAYALRRSLLVVPFAAGAGLAAALAAPGDPILHVHSVTVTRTGLVVGLSLLTKALLASWAILLLAASTRFDHLLAALAWFRVPGLLLDILAFLYRYLFLVVDEAHRLSRARRARAPKRLRRPIRTSASMLANLAARSFQRSERVYLAMVARGYDGRVRIVRPLPRVGLPVFEAAVCAAAFWAAAGPLPGWLGRPV